MTLQLEYYDAQKIHLESPDTFWAPPLEDLVAIKAGDHVKVSVVLTGEDVTGERLWVKVTEVPEDIEDKWKGDLGNDPIYFDGVCGDSVEFDARNIYDILKPGEV